MPTTTLPTSQMETTTGLPLIVRPLPPPGAAIPVAPSNPVAAANTNTSGSGPSLPKLTAAPVAASAKESHAATQLVDPNQPFDPEQTSPGELTAPTTDVKHEPPTDPNRGAIEREAGAPTITGMIDVAIAPTRASPSGQRVNPLGPPILMPATEFSKRPPAMRDPMVPPEPPDPSGSLPMLHDEASNPPVPISAPYTPRMAPAERVERLPDERATPERIERATRPPSSSGSGVSGSPKRRRPPPPSPGGSGLVIAAVVAAILALVVGALVLSGKLKPAQGLLMLDVPEEMQGIAKISVNGKALTETDPATGKERLTISEPQLLKVPAGVVAVMIWAPGYESFTEQVTVTEGNEITRLTKSPIKSKKKEAPAPEPQTP